MALGVPLLATVWVYGPIRDCFFFWDDFSNFVAVEDGGAFRFIITPMAGHVLLTRNAILAASWTLFGLDARPYFVGVLLTHLVNVALLFGFVDRVTGGRTFVAAAIATLWGISPLHAEPLGWYAVYGEVLSTTTMLGVLWDAAGLMRSHRPLTTRRIVTWAGALLVGATCFGTGLAAAMAIPVAIALAIPQARRWPALAGLGAIAVATPLLYLGSRALGVWAGAATAVDVGDMSLATAHPRAPFVMLFHLVRYGLARLLCGPFFYGRTDPGTLSAYVLGATGLLLVATTRRRSNPRRGIAIGLLLLATSIYGVIALGRANLVAASGQEIRAKATALRYHYAGSVALAGMVGALVASVHRPRAADAVALAGTIVVLVRSTLGPQSIATHAGVRGEVVAEIKRLEHAAAGASATHPVRLENRRLSPMVTGIFGPTRTPGVAGLMVLTHPAEQLEDRGVEFVEPSAAVRAAFSAPRSRRLSRLLVAPRVVPGGIPPTGTLPACEFLLVREMARGRRTLFGCEIRDGRDRSAAESCRAAAVKEAVDRMTTVEAGRPCRACFRPGEAMATIGRIVGATGHLWRCLPADAPDDGGTPAMRRCRIRAAHHLVHLDAEVVACHRRAVERTQTLDDPPCVKAAVNAYLARMDRLGPTCAACQSAFVGPVEASLVTARVEDAFCHD